MALELHRAGMWCNTSGCHSSDFNRNFALRGDYKIKSISSIPASHFSVLFCIPDKDSGYSLGRNGIPSIQILLWHTLAKYIVDVGNLHLPRKH